MVVYNTYNLPEAHIVAGRLDYEGVKSWVYQESLGSSMGIHIGPLGEVMVLVVPDDYDRAIAILEVDAEVEDENGFDDE